MFFSRLVPTVLRSPDDRLYEECSQPGRSVGTTPGQRSAIAAPIANTYVSMIVVWMFDCAVFCGSGSSSAMHCYSLDCLRPSKFGAPGEGDESHLVRRGVRRSFTPDPFIRAGMLLCVRLAFSYSFLASCTVERRKPSKQLEPLVAAVGWLDSGCRFDVRRWRALQLGNIGVSVARRCFDYFSFMGEACFVIGRLHWL